MQRSAAIHRTTSGSRLSRYISALAASEQRLLITHTIKQSKSVLAVADSRAALVARMRARTGRLRISGAVPYMPPGAAPSGSPSPSSAGSDSGNCEMFLCEQQASGQ